MKIPAIIVDLDGTLYDCEERRKAFLRPDKKDFDGFNAAAEDDPPHAWCLSLVQSMKARGFKILLVSGREEKYREGTVNWLRCHLNWKKQDEDYVLVMRPSGIYAKDAEIKKDIYKTLFADKYEVIFVVDDRKQVVDMWRSLGLTCLQCAEGDF